MYNRKKKVQKHPTIKAPNQILHILLRIFLLLFYIQESNKLDVCSIFKSNAPLAKVVEAWGSLVKAFLSRIILL
jgi:hypothetical protein